MSLRGRLLGGLVVWGLSVGAFVAVAHPETCGTRAATDAELWGAADAAVAWLAANQEPSGKFTYRYDRDGDVIEPGYHLARHAGVMLSLYQADRSGLAGARESGDLALDWALERSSEHDDRLALGTGSSLESGPAALLTAALVERRLVAGDATHDETLRALGRFLIDNVRPDGSVAAEWEAGSGPVDGSSSPFYTGETMWALARLETVFPGEGWGGHARRIGDYVAATRDDLEPRFPPVSDHWWAYAIEEIARWPGAPGLTDTDLDYVDRQAAIFGLQARYESQRRADGLERWTRGPVALAAGLGTVGEGLGGLTRLSRIDPGAAEKEGPLLARAECVSAMLVERQATAGETLTARESLEAGAWFRLGVTQMDDQQHALSAILALLELRGSMR